MPLVTAGLEVAGEAEVTERQERARKVRPEYAQGEPVVVAGARHQAEAELIQGFLLEEGIPSMHRRARGFDVPDFLAAGPRDVLVPASGAEAARDVLRRVDEAYAAPATAPRPPDAPRGRTTRLTAVVLVATLAVAGLAPLLAWLLDL